jgi:hypothetical protein
MDRSEGAQHYLCMTRPGQQAVAEWNRWVTEIEDHALDPFEFEILLEARAALPEALEIAGSESLWEHADTIDARFVAVTIEDANSPFASPAQESWWWRRLPADDEFRRYALGES